MNNKLKITDKNKLNKILRDWNMQGFYKFNKIRHECTNYNQLVSVYNKTGDYMLLCNQVISLLGPVLGSTYKPILKDYYTKKVRMNS